MVAQEEISTAPRECIRQVVRVLHQGMNIELAQSLCVGSRGGTIKQDNRDKRGGYASEACRPVTDKLQAIAMPFGRI